MEPKPAAAHNFCRLMLVPMEAAITSYITQRTPVLSLQYLTAWLITVEQKKLIKARWIDVSGQQYTVVSSWNLFEFSLSACFCLRCIKEFFSQFHFSSNLDVPLYASSLVWLDAPPSLSPPPLLHLVSPCLCKAASRDPGWLDFSERDRPPRQTPRVNPAVNTFNFCV